jgi:hypothetical protein
MLTSASLGKSGEERRWYEELYRTPSGTYFLIGTGGSKSHWAREGMRILSAEQAKTWVERWANESYERIFGKVGEA